MTKEIIKIADIKKRIEAGESLSFVARSVQGVNGYYLDVESQDGIFILATYLSDLRLFKRSDAILKELRGLGVESVLFELS